ncbi:lysozyme inhibitor LprI family protein [uncultured Brevundimonas sp.]|uniref:lysozyme inhibitor LprI family protein n=1 Tax=uncultured Brevundimonas sp. TaxID=213418 RepID=UPI00259843B2|nr:lysozyme inhibitor LprI family protein [uncultured Brevundimonas sp.]
MTFPTNIPIPVIVAVVGLTGLVLGWFINGLGFLLKRKLAGTPKTERAAYLNTVTDLAAKMRASGMTIEDVHAFEAALRNPAVASSEAATGVVDALDLDEGPRAFDTNYAMKSRARAAYDVAEAQLSQALTDLRLLSGGDNEMLDEVQKRWTEYRTALEDRELARYQGGTHATLALALAGLAETERRTEEIRAEVAERSAR